MSLLLGYFFFFFLKKESWLCKDCRIFFTQKPSWWPQRSLEDHIVTTYSWPEWSLEQTGTVALESGTKWTSQAGTRPQSGSEQLVDVAERNVDFAATAQGCVNRFQRVVESFRGARRARRKATGGGLQNLTGIIPATRAKSRSIWLALVQRLLI